MTSDEVVAEFRRAGAILDGHFILSSGLHSPTFIQKMAVFQYPVLTARICSALAQKVNDAFGTIDVVVSPAIGGIIPGYETARWLGARAVFLEKESNQFVLRRSFTISSSERVLLLEDVMTTGQSIQKCLTAIRGCNVVGAACLIDRSGGKSKLDINYVSLATLNIPVYAANELPELLKVIPITKLGGNP